MRARPELLPRLNGWLPGGDIYDLMVGMGIGFVDNNQMLCAFSMRNRGTQPTMFTPGTTGGLFFSSFSWFIRWQRQQLVQLICTGCQARAFLCLLWVLSADCSYFRLEHAYLFFNAFHYLIWGTLLGSDLESTRDFAACA